MSMDFTIHDIHNPDDTKIIKAIFNVCNANGATLCYQLSLDAYCDGGQPGRGGDCDVEVALSAVERWLSLSLERSRDYLPDSYVQGRMHELYDALTGALEDHPGTLLKLSWG